MHGGRIASSIAYCEFMCEAKKQNLIRNDFDIGIEKHTNSNIYIQKKKNCVHTGLRNKRVWKLQHSVKRNSWIND